MPASAPAYVFRSLGGGLKGKKPFGVAAGGGLAGQGDISKLHPVAAPSTVQKPDEVSVQRSAWIRLCTQPLLLTFGQGG